MGCGASRINSWSKAAKSLIVASDRPTRRNQTAVTTVTVSEKLSTDKEDETERPDTYGSDDGQRSPSGRKTEVEVEVELSLTEESGSSEETKSLEKASNEEEKTVSTPAENETGVEQEGEIDKSTTTELPEVKEQAKQTGDVEEERQPKPEQMAAKTDQSSEDHTEIPVDDAKTKKAEENVEPTQMEKLTEKEEEPNKAAEGGVKGDTEVIPASAHTEQTQQSSSVEETATSVETKKEDEVVEVNRTPATEKADTNLTSKQINQPAELKEDCVQSSATEKPTEAESINTTEEPSIADEKAMNTESTAAEKITTTEIINTKEEEKKESLKAPEEMKPPPQSEKQVEVNLSEEIEGNQETTKEMSKSPQQQQDIITSEKENKPEIEAIPPSTAHEEKNDPQNKEEPVNSEVKETENTETKIEEPTSTEAPTAEERKSTESEPPAVAGDIASVNQTTEGSNINTTENESKNEGGKVQQQSLTTESNEHAMNEPTKSDAEVSPITDKESLPAQVIEKEQHQEKLMEAEPKEGGENTSADKGSTESVTENTIKDDAGGELEKQSEQGSRAEDAKKDETTAEGNSSPTEKASVEVKDHSSPAGDPNIGITAETVVQKTNGEAEVQPNDVIPPKPLEKLDRQSKSCTNSQVDLSQNAPAIARSQASLDKVEGVQMIEKLEIDHSTGQSQASLVETVEKSELPPTHSSTSTTTT